MAIIKPNNNTISAITSLPAGVGGKVLQTIVTNSTQVNQDISSGSFTDITGMTASITPSSTSSKILIFGNIHASFESNEGFGLQIVRTIGGSATNLRTTSNAEYAYFYDGSGTIAATQSPVFTVDTPNSTSECTYKWQVITSGTVKFQSQGRSYSSFNLLEIGA